MQRIHSSILFLSIICLLLTSCTSGSNEKPSADTFPGGTMPFNDMLPSDVESIVVTCMPPNTSKEITNTAAISEFVTILNNVVTYKRDNSFGEYNGQWVEFEITKTNGETLVVAAYNPFLIIDGKGYETEYEPCEQLNALGNRWIE